MNTNEGQALFSRIQENLADLAPQLIFSDWLEEQERLNEALLWRGIKPTELDSYELYSDGSGSGDGFCYGYCGIGYGYGSSSGDGFCYGDGDGFGRGNSFGSGFGSVNDYGYDVGFECIQERDAWLKQNEKIINYEH